MSHGAPVLQAVEIYRKRPIFYSLGNFIFHVPPEEGVWRAPEVWESVIGACTFDEDNILVKAILHPLIIGGEDTLNGTDLDPRLVPELVMDKTAERVLHRFQQQSADFGTKIEIAGGVGVIRI